MYKTEFAQSEDEAEYANESSIMLDNSICIIVSLSSLNSDEMEHMQRFIVTLLF